MITVKRKSSTGFELEYRVGGYVAGVIDVKAGEFVNPALQGTMAVTYIEVAQDTRRQGVGTKLYEAAAAMACNDYGRPLSSDQVRSGYAEAFWSKQEAKGRATERQLSGMDDDDADYDYDDDADEDAWMAEQQNYDTAYVLTCPPPASLGLWSAPRRRRRR